MTGCPAVEVDIDGTGKDVHSPSIDGVTCGWGGSRGDDIDDLVVRDQHILPPSDTIADDSAVHDRKVNHRSTHRPSIFISTSFLSASLAKPAYRIAHGGEILQRHLRIV